MTTRRAERESPRRRTALAVAAGAAGIALAGSAFGGVELSVQSGGSSAIQVVPGQTFTFEVVLTPDLSEATDSAIFSVVLGAEGLEASDDWYAWALPYETGGLDDFSMPGIGALASIDAMTYATPGDPAAIDLYFENLTPSAQDLFTFGTLLSVSLTVPSDWAGPESFEISVVPDTFTSGTSIVDSRAGAALSVIVIPGPGTAGGIAIVGLAGMRRRRP